ncbi:MAG TPA: flagellar hook capping FlgD N-terminal domain-containing protein, partial [candidate division Zixibacteria bacterium]|nr:flagellar hook capping FlgD N-terminal domain-containing protein [candidate division Zixibacteria bacterium]
MSFISPIPTDSNGQQKQTGSLQSLGKDDFLQLLVTKLENQDPLNPASDEQFISDLAQFSSLEQMNNIAGGIDKSNQLDYLSSQSLNNVMASGLIGKEVTSEYKGIYVGGSDSAAINFTLDSPAQQVDFTISDSDGNVVAHLTDKDPSVGVNSFKWD